MRICFISQEYPPETEGGGIGTYTRMVAKGLAGLGHEVHVICQTFKDAYETVDGQIQVHRVPARLDIPLINRMLYPVLPSTLNCHAWTRSARKKYDELAAVKPFEVIETAEFMAQGLYFRHIPGAPLVTKLHTPMFMVHELNQTPETFDLKWAKGMERKATLGSDGVSSCSTDLGVKLKAKWGLREVRTVHNPIDTDEFTATCPVSREPHVVFAGKLSLRKGTDILGLAIPQVLKAIPNARFTFAGKDTTLSLEGGSMKEFILKHLSAREAAQVVFLGQTPHAEMKRVYDSCSIVAAPSRYENFPYVCLEPMACGRGCIGTAVGGIPEIIDEGVTGRLVPPEDVDALAKVIVETLRDPEIPARFGAAARKAVEARFAGPVIARKTEEFYREVIARRGSNGRAH